MRLIEQAKNTYYPLRIAIEKQTKTTEEQRKNKIEAIAEHGKQVFVEKELQSISLDNRK